MLYKYEFDSQTDYNNLIAKNENKFLIEVHYLIEGNYLVFSSEKPIELQIAELENTQKQQDQAMLETSLQLAMLTNNLVQGGSKNDL